jgi:hypothetical protein
MATKKKARKVKAKSTSRKRSTKRAKDLSPRGGAKSVKGGLLPAVKPTTYRSKWPDNPNPGTNPGTFNPGTMAAGDGSV